MNRDRLYLGFVTALIVTVVIYASYGLLNSEKKDTHYVVSVIVSNSGSDRWNAFKEGLNQGADEAGLYLNVVSAPAFSRVEEEYGIIGRELVQMALLWRSVILRIWAEDFQNSYRKTVSYSLIPIWIWRGDTRSCSRMPRRSEKPSPR